MTLDELRRVYRQMTADARIRYRAEAMALCRTADERTKAASFESAIGEVSPEEAVLALKRWIQEQRSGATV